MTKLGDIFNKYTEKQQFSSAEKHWDDLESMLDKHDSTKKGGAMWRTISLGVIAVLLLTGWFTLNNNSFSEIAAVEPQSKSIIGQNSNDDAQEIAVTDNSKVIDEELNFANQELSNAEELKNEIQEIEKQIDQENEGENKLVSNQVTQKIDNEIAGNSPKIVNRVNLPATIEQKSEAETVQPIATMAKTNISGSEMLSNTNTDNLPDNETITAANINETEVDNSLSSDTDLNTSLNVLTNQIEEITVDLSLMDLLETNKFTNEMNIIQPTQEDFIEGTNSKFRFELGIYGGPMYVGKYLKSTANLDYIDRRKNEEKGRLSFNSGLDINLKYGKFLVSTGVNYHQQGEVTNYSNEYEQWVGSDNVTYDVIDNSFWQVNTSSFTVITDENYTTTVDTNLTYYDESNSMYVTDTVGYQLYVINNIGTQQFNLVDSTYIVQHDSTEIITQDSSLTLVTDANNPQQKTTTRFSYVEVPILFGYEFPINRLTLSFKTGVGLGFLTKYEATYLLADYSSPQLVDKSQVDQFVLNYLLRVGLNYAINENVAVRLEPFYRLNLTNVLISTELAQKYWNAGLNVGVVYGF
ncbi:MAG: hypothetical protein JKY53_02105 [Flavobacteriales bacterium]|nr:hypothetical protein [Flavobacteriales bacterium]